MKAILYIVFVSLASVSFMIQDTGLKTINPTISTEEIKLYNLIMEYRNSENLPKIPLSKSLTYVAQEHCKDLVINKPDRKNGCNAHSWSDKGEWSACCYTPDHDKSSCMWDKPRELTSYEDNGFEIACRSSDPQYQNFIMTADYALDSWKKSYHHNLVIINKGVWKDSKWNAIGIGIYKGFATVWFGKSPDPEGELLQSGE